MASNTTPDVHKNTYSPIARVLHWLIAGMIVVQFVLAQLSERAEDAGHSFRQLGLLANHKSVGITVFGLAVLRLIWRVLNAPPTLPHSMPRWQTRASHFSHRAFYLLLFALPISGWLMSSASAYSVSWFNLLQLPDLVAPAPALKHIFEDIHEILAKLLLILAGVHVLAAIKHWLFDKDGVMGRMASAGGVLIFVVIIIVGVAALGRAGLGDREGATDAGGPSPGSETGVVGELLSGGSGASSMSQPLAASNLPVWNIDYANSHIRFTADQAGAEFTGEWRQWQAQLQFSKEALADSRFDVTIDTAHVDTRDAERDAVLTEPGWFDVANFPHAYYHAGQFVARPDGSFVAHGQLRVKGQSFPVDLTFTVSENNGRRSLNGMGTAVLLNGSTKLDRLKLRIGTGEWLDTSTVGKTVVVNVRIEALTGVNQAD